MMSLTEAQEQIKADIIYRARQEAKDAGLVIKCIVFDVEKEEEMYCRSQVVEFLSEYIEKSENKRDIITTRELFDKYDDWFRGRKLSPMDYIDGGPAALGKYMGQLDYNKYIGKLNGKTVRGYTNIRWKSETSKVNDFMIKFTINTQDAEDRIALQKLVCVYKEYTGEKISSTEFINKARKYGYKLKAAVEKPYYICSTTGKKKKREGQDIEHCVTKLKWISGAVENLNAEGLKEKLRVES